MSRVLVVDDQSPVRATILLALRAEGFEGIGVESGTAALTELAATHFDLAIVDIFMLGMDGLAVIKALRERRPSLPVIAISGVDLDPSGRTALDLLPTALQQGDIICLKKPFRREELLEAVERAIGGSRACG